MSADEYASIVQQHIQLFADIERIWVAIAVLAFVGLVFLAVMFGLAIWSVRTVNRRQLALERKFELLIDVLLAKAQKENQDASVN